MFVGGGFAALLVPSSALAVSPFDGTWKADLKTAQLPQKPQTILLKDGVFTCSTCKPVFTVKADGAFHPITNQPYTDEAKMEVVDEHTIVETDKLKGKVTNVARQTVSTDGKTMTASWTDTSAPDGKATTGSGTMTRVGMAPAGAHAISGSWRQASVANISDAALTETLALNGDWLSLTTPNGYSYKAKLGGQKVPLVGDTAETMVAVKRTGAMTLFEEDSRKGEVVNTYTMTLLPGGKTMKVVSRNAKQGTDTIYVMKKL